MKSTPGCASCAADTAGRELLSAQARPVRDRRDGARDARARDRRRRGAGPRAAGAGRALRARLRRRVPVGHARVRRLDRHRREPGRARDPRHELVPPRGAPLRRVRLELPRRPALRHRAPADRHGLQHEPRPPLVRDADGVRDARRRRRAHRRHHLPDVPRAPPPRAPARHRPHARRLGAHAPRGDGPARALLRRHLRLAAAPAAARASACPACATVTPAACPPTWSSTTCSTSCCCRCPTTTGTRTSAAPRRRSSRSARPTSSSPA